jgi:hypothetical protein
VTQQGYRHRILVIDRSGSIQHILGGQQSGLSEFFGSEAKVPGRATFSVWDFDDEVRCIGGFAPLEEVRGYRIKPRNMTALYDAIGTALVREGELLAALPEDKRPEDVTMIISTDGLENASQQYTSASVRALLEEQRARYGWRVLYMGANQDAFAEGEKFGATRGMTVNSVGTDAGSRNSWKMSADYLSRVPVASAAAVGSLDLTDDERVLGESGEEE